MSPDYYGLFVNCHIVQQLACIDGTVFFVIKDSYSGLYSYYRHDRMVINVHIIFQQQVLLERSLFLFFKDKCTNLLMKSVFIIQKYWILIALIWVVKKIIIEMDIIKIIIIMSNMLMISDHFNFIESK